MSPPGVWIGSLGIIVIIIIAKFIIIIIIIIIVKFIIIIAKFIIIIAKLITTIIIIAKLIITNPSSCPSLVDLAGSESVSKTSGKDRKAEGVGINESLLHLGNVIRALAKNAPYIPHR